MTTYVFEKPIAHTPDVIGNLAMGLALIACNQATNIRIRIEPSRDPELFDLIIDGHASATVRMVQP